MALRCIVGIVCSCLLVVSFNISAATYSLTFYEKVSVGFNLFDNYIVSGTGSFEINDAAVTPNNLVLFSDSNFLAFDAMITATGGSAQFTLGVDDFPPFGDGTSTVHTAEQGILFDASGQPLRFDNPDTIYGNNGQICDPTCDTAVGNKAAMVLFDDNGFDLVFLNDGSIVSLSSISSEDAFTPLGGAWNFEALGSGGLVSNLNNFYLIQAVPVPAAVWLFGSGLLGLIGVARHKKA